MGLKVNYGPLKEIQMSENEVSYVKKCISGMHSNGLMVEWGSGGSTVEWLSVMKDMQSLYSIEHNKEWYEKVKSYVRSDVNLSKKFTYYYSPEKHGYNHGYASVTEEHPIGLENYLKPSEDIFNADIYLIDGIARASCLLYVKMLKKKENPVILIHDYYGREKWYEWAMQLFEYKEKVGDTMVRVYL